MLAPVTLKVMLHGEDDSQRRFLAQHSVAMLEQCCNHSKQCRNNVATLCCAKNHRCKSSCVTSSNAALRVKALNHPIQNFIFEKGVYPVCDMGSLERRIRGKDVYDLLVTTVVSMRILLAFQVNRPVH